MYTTNAIESVNSSFRKVTKKGAFPNEDAVFKIFYLRIQELYKKWKGRHVANWAMVRNQLLMDDRMSQLMQYKEVAYGIDLHKTLDTPKIKGDSPRK